jgi:hypothetical protein
MSMPFVINIDANFGSILSAISDLSIIIASIAAIWGISAWRREAIGRRKIELAEEVYCLFYQARDAIGHIRNSVGYFGEGSSREPLPNETESQKSARDTYYTTIERYNKHSELFGKLYSKKYAFQYYFGEKGIKPYDDLYKIVNRIIVSAKMLISVQSKDDVKDHSESLSKKIQCWEKDIWDYYEGEDEINVKIGEIMNSIEQITSEVSK